MKNHRLWLPALIFLAYASLAQADVPEAAHEVKDATVHAVKKTGQVAREVGHATAHAAKAVGHGVASAARSGYHATKRAVDPAK